MAYKLLDLPYSFDALEPYIDAKTMEIHHNKHHAGYITKVNDALKGHDTLLSQPINKIIANINSLPQNLHTAVRNNGGGHANHELFWAILGKNNGEEPKGDLGIAIKENFGSYNAFKEEFIRVAMTLFGSGWAWLVVQNEKLAIGTTPNQDNPLMDVAGFKGSPIMNLDVWEHAYYLKYQNRRTDYITAFWNVVNWKAVEEKYHAVKS